MNKLQRIIATPHTFDQPFDVHGSSEAVRRATSVALSIQLAVIIVQYLHDFEIVRMCSKMNRTEATKE
jgi:hypothetical protein